MKKLYEDEMNFQISRHILKETKTKNILTEEEYRQVLKILRKEYNPFISNLCQTGLD